MHTNMKFGYWKLSLCSGMLYVILKKNTSMSDSYHVTIRDFKGYTKKELDEMVSDPDSLLTEWSKKRALKKSIKKNRKGMSNSIKLTSSMDIQMIDEIEQLKKNIFRRIGSWLSPPQTNLVILVETRLQTF